MSRAGHARERSPGRWELRWRDPAKRLHTATVSAKSERDAYTQLAALAAAPQAAPHRLTLGDYLPRWLASIDVKQTTRQGYASVVRTYLAPGLGHIRLRELSASAIRAAFMTWAGNGTARSSLRQVKIVLQSCLRSALIDDLIAVDPMAKLRARKGEKNPLPIGMPAKAVPVSAERIAELLADDCGDYKIAVVLIVAAGLRRGEALGLRWRNVDLDAGRITIVEQRVPLIGGPAFAEPKSKSGVRTIKLPVEAIDALRDHWRATATRLLALGFRLTEAHTVACNALGAPLDPNSFGSWARRRRIKLHNLRHAHISALVNSGVPIAAVSKRAGHSTIATTIATYVHAEDADDDAAAAIASRFLVANQ
jgi:integrase